MDDTFNELAIKVHARKKDTPGKRWWHLNAWHPDVGRALNINREGPEAFYALLPFRLTRHNGQPAIAVAYPCPHFLTDVEDWLGIDMVVLWNPATNAATVYGDDTPQLVGNIEQSVIYADPRAFFQDWCRRRAQFYAQRQASIHNHWTAPLAEHDETPGVLMTGDAQAIRWPVHSMPDDLMTVGIDPQAINRAILKQARVPRARQAMRAVA